jgi:hypothetical protein
MSQQNYHIRPTAEKDSKEATAAKIVVYPNGEDE